MDMNKKGFTLIEIISVIAILGIVGVIATISFTKTLKDTQAKSCADFKESVEEAACIYATLNKEDSNGVKVPNCNDRINGCVYSLRELINYDMIDYDKNDCNEDLSLDRAYVKVSWKNGEKVCEYYEG